MSGAIVTMVGLIAGTAWMVYAWRNDVQNRLPATYVNSQRLYESNWTKLAVALGAICFISAPIGFSWLGYKGIHLPSKLVPGLPLSEFGLSVLTIAGILSIGVLALNLLTGFAGQVSLGHAAFIGIGAYAAGYFGQQFKIGGRHMPFVAWLVTAAILGGLISAAIGPFALRLRGDYLAVISLGLLVLSEHIFNNFTSVTGGKPGRHNLPAAMVTLWPDKNINFSLPETGETEFFGTFLFSRNQGYFWLTWAIVALCVIIAKNLIRSRSGRAMMAVRDRDLSAEAIGVELSTTKVWAFAVCGGMAGLSGALYGSYIQSITPEFFNLNLSIQYVAMMIVGGSGTVAGSIIGALVISPLELTLQRFRWIFEKGFMKKIFFFISSGPGEPGMQIAYFVRMIYGLALVAFLVFLPKGIVGLWEKFKTSIKRWPFGI